MLIDGRLLVFEKFEADVRDAVRNSNRMPTQAPSDENSTPHKWPLAEMRLVAIPKPITKIAVSEWLKAELRYRLQYRQMVDYCDGVGPRPVWFHIVVDLDPTLTGQQVRLS